MLETSLPPHDIEAEEAVIASCMVPDGWIQIPAMAAIVTPDDFFREKHGWIFAAALDVWRRGEQPNQIVVAHELAGADRLEQLGGQAFLSDVIRRLSTPLGAEFYAKIVARLAQYRRAMALFHEATRRAMAAPAEPSDVFEWVVQRVMALDMGHSRALTRSAAEILQGDRSREGLLERTAEFLEAPGEIRGLPTGWAELDSMLNGLMPSRLYAILADTSVGKSFLCHFIAWFLVRQGIPVHIVTTEMGDDEVLERMCYMEAGLDPQRVRERGATDSEKRRIGEAQTLAMDWPLFITNVGKIRIDTLAAEARRMVVSHGTQVLFVDHIQHVRVPGAQGVAVLEETTATLKAIAVDASIPVVMVSHVNRASRGEGLGLNSGKGAGSIEQDSNVVMTLEPVCADPMASGWRVMEGKELTTFKERWNFVPVRLTSHKSRSGGQSVLIRKLAFSKGGRFIPLEEEC